MENLRDISLLGLHAINNGENEKKLKQVIRNIACSMSDDQFNDNTDIFLLQEWRSGSLRIMEANRLVSFFLEAIIISNSESVLPDRIVNYLESFHFDQSVTATLNDTLYERFILQVSKSQSDSQENLGQEYPKHFYNLRLYFLSNKREFYSPRYFYTKKRKKRTVRIGFFLHIIIYYFFNNNRKTIHIKNLREWIQHLKRRKLLFQPMHKRKTIFSLKQKENTTQDVSFRDEENRPPHLTSVYCVPCPSIIDVGNRIHPMRGDNA